MNRLFPVLLFVLISSLSLAQTIERTKELLKEKKIEEAKIAIDKLMADSKFQNNPEAWYLKAKVYNAISLDPTLSKSVPEARLNAFNALKKYTEIDDKLLISLQIDGYKPINDIYTGYYQNAANSFNQQNYEQALKDFKNALMVSSFMTSKKWINLSLDTNSVLYAGVSAEKLNKAEEAAEYYNKLVEAKVKGEGFVEIYKWVANHFFETKKYEKSRKAIALGRDVYPNDPFWNSLELDMTRETGTRQELFSKYAAVIAAEPRNHLYRYNYAVELYQYAYNTDSAKRPADSEQLINKATEELENVIELKPDYSKAQLFAGQIHYNKGIDLLKKSKAQALGHFDKAIPYFLETEKLISLSTTRSAADKRDLKEALDLLATIYDQKGEKEKVKLYEEKFKQVD